MDASRHLWNARVDPRRRTYAAGIYTQLLDCWGIVYDQPIVLNERQAGAAVEGVEQHNRSQDRIRLSLLAVDKYEVRRGRAERRRAAPALRRSMSSHRAGACRSAVRQWPGPSAAAYQGHPGRHPVPPWRVRYLEPSAGAVAFSGQIDTAAPEMIRGISDLQNG